MPHPTRASSVPLISTFPAVPYDGTAGLNVLKRGAEKVGVSGPRPSALKAEVIVLLTSYDLFSCPLRTSNLAVAPTVLLRVTPGPRPRVGAGIGAHVLNGLLRNSTSAIVPLPSAKIELR